MLEHERQHVRARDPLLLHAAAFCALLMPWNVAVWWLVRRLRLAVELDCDARVLATGRDARTYGTRLLNVCSRRVRTGAMLAPALLERTSSLAKRILAMQPERGRHSRARITLGGLGACAVALVACEMPTPEMLAPDGKNAAVQRLYGSGLLTANATPSDVVKRYFPAVARGEGGPSILFIVKSANGEVVLTDRQPAGLARQRESGQTAVGSIRGRVPSVQTQAPGPRVAVGGPQRTGTPNSGPDFPAGIGAINPNEIASVDITKHAAGAVAPEPTSIITIVLKEGARVAADARQ
jgi:hypothetical protein